MCVRPLALCLAILSLTTSRVFGESAGDDVERRVDSLLRQMTLDEKVGQLVQHPSASPQTRELIKAGKVGSLLGHTEARATNEVQRIAVEESRLKIPLIFGFDVIHGYRTIFPVPVASAGSFDLPLIEQSERVAAKEATAGGVKWTFAPMVDIARDPRWGRIVEGAGEDPYLGSVVAAARVRGFQGQHLSDPDSLVACVKHYVAYGAAEGGRDYNTVDISDSLLREVYLPPFKAAVDAGAATLMASFQDLNGIPATANHYTLTDILRGEWGFRGFVVSDYDGVRELITHGAAEDKAEASLRALTAGVEMDMASDSYRTTLPDLVTSGKIPMSVLDEAVRRVLRIKIEAGLFEKPYTDLVREGTDLLTPESLRLARTLAQESMVLLRNEGGTLPLKAAVKTVAVIGPLADDKANQLGPWSGSGRAADVTTPLAALRERLKSATVLYAKGADLVPFSTASTVGMAPAPASATGATEARANTGPASIDEAVRIARRSDVAVLFLGELTDMNGEAGSRATLDLPGAQQQLLEAVVATGKPVVLVLESGRPLDIRWAAAHVPAILQAWYPGTAAGPAIADILSGDVAPSGRLSVSWPRSVGQIPTYYNHRNTGRPSSPNRWHSGYQDLSSEPLFPFGYGLTYTQFQYSHLTVSTPTLTSTGVLRVSAEVENSGATAGTEVVQLYVRDRVAPTSRPVRELKAFARVSLAPGERKTVELTARANDLGSYDTAMKWIVPAGTYDVWVAPNAAEGLHGELRVQ